MLKVILLIFIIIILVLWLSYKNELFENSYWYPTRMYGMSKHARLDKYNRVESVDIKPPSLKTGESRCDKVLCPVWVPSDVICYICK